MATMYVRVGGVNVPLNVLVESVDSGYIETITDTAPFVEMPDGYTGLDPSTTESPSVTPITPTESTVTVVLF